MRTSIGFILLTAGLSSIASAQARIGGMRGGRAAPHAVYHHTNTFKNTFKPPTVWGNQPGIRPYPVPPPGGAAPAGLEFHPPAGGSIGISPNAYRYGFRGRGHSGRRSGSIIPYVFPSFPYYGWDTTDYTSDPNQATPAQPEFDSNLGAEVDRLRDEVDRLKSANSAPSPAAPPPSATPAAEQTPLPQEPPVILVFRDGKQRQTSNYAIMDRVFWDFSAQPVKRIPLSQLDLATSARLTEEHGGEFPKISSSK